MWWAWGWDVEDQFELAAVMRTPDLYDELYEDLYGDDYQDEIQAIRSGLSTH